MLQNLEKMPVRGPENRSGCRQFLPPPFLTRYCDLRLRDINTSKNSELSLTHSILPRLNIGTDNK